MQVQELVSQRVKLNEESRALWAAIDGAKREPTGEERGRLEAINAEVNALRDKIEAAATQAEADRQLRQAHEAEERALAETRGRRTESQTRPDAAHTSDADLDLAFRAWAMGRHATPAMREAAGRCGVDLHLPYIDMAYRTRLDERGQEVRSYVPVVCNRDLEIEAWRGRPEARALSVGTTTAGGNAVPDEMMRAFYEIQKWYARFPNEALNITTETGASLPWPIVTDTGNTGRLLAEATTATTTTDPTFTQVVLGSFKFSSDAVLVSWELLQDSFINIPQYLGRALATRLGRIKNTKATVGAGTTEPKGIIPAATVGVTAASSTAFTFDEVIDLIHSLDPAYRNLPGTGFMLHDSTAKVLRKFKDGEGRYLWEMSTQVGQPDRLLGYPVLINNDMASALTTGQKLILFGNWGISFIVRNAGATRFQRLDELKALEHQVVFEALERWDSNSVDTTAAKVLALG